MADYRVTTLLGVRLGVFSVMQLKRKFMRVGRAFDYKVTTEVVDAMEEAIHIF